MSVEAQKPYTKQPKDPLSLSRENNRSGIGMGSTFRLEVRGVTVYMVETPNDLKLIGRRKPLATLEEWYGLRRRAEARKQMVDDATGRLTGQEQRGKQHMPEQQSQKPDGSQHVLSTVQHGKNELEQLVVRAVNRVFQETAAMTRFSSETSERRYQEWLAGKVRAEEVHASNGKPKKKSRI